MEIASNTPEYVGEYQRVSLDDLFRDLFQDGVLDELGFKKIIVDAENYGWVHRSGSITDFRITPALSRFFTWKTEEGNQITARTSIVVSIHGKELPPKITIKGYATTGKIELGPHYYDIDIIIIPEEINGKKVNY